MLKKKIIKKNILSTLLFTGLLTVGSYTAYAGEADTSSEMDSVRVVARASDEGFFSIALDVNSPDNTEDAGASTSGNIYFEGINLHNDLRLSPAGGEDVGINVLINSHTNFSLAVAASGDFMAMDDSGASIPISHLRTRVHSRTFEETTINTVENGNSGNHNNNAVQTINTSHNFTPLTTNAREIIRNTNAHGNNINYHMRFDFLSSMDIPVGDFETTILYTAWQN